MADLSPKEYAERHGVHEKTVRRMILAGRLNATNMSAGGLRPTWRIAPDAEPRGNRDSLGLIGARRGTSDTRASVDLSGARVSRACEVSTSSKRQPKVPASSSSRSRGER